MIEDNTANLRLMLLLLKKYGHEALGVNGGQEGVETARRERPEVILLDIHMPRMDGYEVARVLRADAAFDGIPILAVTALAMVGDRERVLASGFSGYISKPIEPETFVDQVQRFLGEASFTTREAQAQSQQVQLPPAPPTPVEPSESSKLAVVLVVDNSEVNILFLRRLLERSGYEVVVARSPKEGLELASRIRLDLILSDVHMSPLDGFDLLRMAQIDPELSKVPFVFLSSSVLSSRERERALAGGARKFITRPIEPRSLLEELKVLIPVRTK